MRRWLALTLLLLAPMALSQAKIVRHANAFLHLGNNAASEALACTDLASRYRYGSERSNPAGLIGMDRRFTLGGSFLSQFGDMGRLGNIGLAYRVDSVSGIAFCLTRFSVSGIPNTLSWMDEEGNTDYTKISHFSIADWALHISYGRSILLPGLSIGGTVKAIYRHQGPFARGVGFGVDLGVRYQYKSWEFAAVGRDLSATSTVWFIYPNRLKTTGPDSIQNDSKEFDRETTLPSLRLGGGYHWDTPKGWRIALNLLTEWGFDGADAGLFSHDWFKLDLAVGSEFSYRNIVFIRMGARQFQWIREFYDHRTLSFNPSLGLGLSGWGLSLDYALSAPIATVDLRLSHLITLSYAFSTGQERNSRMGYR